jgi:hypothetical protein
MIGTGLVLDVVRWTLSRQRSTQTYWLREVSKALSDPAYAARLRYLYQLSQISTVAIFLLHGVLWVVLAPLDDGRASASILMHLYPEPRAILRISHIARSYLSELDRQGYQGRGQLWEGFVCQSFVIYVAVVLLWTFWAAKGATVLNLVVRNEAISKRDAKLKPFSSALALCGVFSIGGFVVINNWGAYGWTSQHNPLATSNGFFMVYSIQMLFSCLIAVWSLPFAIPYCSNFEALMPFCPDREVSKSPLQGRKIDRWNKKPT